jgi:hypothetical protein
MAQVFHEQLSVSQQLAWNPKVIGFITTESTLFQFSKLRHYPIGHSPLLVCCICMLDVYDISGAVTVIILLYKVVTNDVSDYINLLVRIAHIICNHSLF